MKRSLFGLLLCGAVGLAGCGDDTVVVEGNTDGTNNDTGTVEPGADAGMGSESDGGMVMDDAGTSEDGGGTVEPPACVFPTFSGVIDRGQVFPDFAWNAKLSDGTDYVLDMVEFYCDDDKYGQYDTVLFTLSTEWCPYCPDFQRYVDAFHEELEARGMLVVFTELQNASGGPIGSAQANNHINQATPNGTGIRLGDQDNIYSPNAMATGQAADFFPSSLVVRRSDMMVIADARDASDGAYLPLAEIAADPTGDWSSPGSATIRPELPLPEPNCTEDEEEASESGDTIDSITVLEVGSIEGGICTDNFDFYEITLEGDWTVDLLFTHNVGDLDVYRVQDDGQVLTGDDGRPVGSESTTDNEQISGTGPAKFVVTGYNGSTAPYTLTLSEGLPE